MHTHEERRQREKKGSAHVGTHEPDVAVAMSKAHVESGEELIPGLALNGDIAPFSASNFLEAKRG